MTVTKPSLPSEIVTSIVLNGDLSKLNDVQLTQYYIYRCEQLGLDPVTKPFDILNLQGKKVLYANKQAAAQLRALNKISTAITSEQEWNGILVIKVRAWLPDGRQHEDQGFASLNGLGGEALGNARLKAVTKATRRSILGLCGLGELDETEVESIPAAKSSVFQEARTILTQPQPVNGSDAIQLKDIKSVDEEKAEVVAVDTQDREWVFRGEWMKLAVDFAGKPDMMMIDYVKDGNRYIVTTAQV